MKILHYTRVDSFDKIVNPNSGLIFHLSDCRLVNDPSEMEVFKNYLVNNSVQIQNLLEESNAKVFRRLIDRHKMVFLQDKWMFGLSFIWSLTTRYDSALYWNSKYANTNGIGFVFEHDKLMEYSKKSEFADRYREISYIDHEVNSNDLDIRISKRFNELLECWRTEQKRFELDEAEENAVFATLILNEGPFYKHISWEHENEWRLVISKDVMPKSHIDKNKMEVIARNYYDNNTKFKTIQNTLLPFEEINLPKESISKILLGPSCTMVNKEIAENYLHICGFGRIEVEISKCPIRSFG